MLKKLNSLCNQLLSEETRMKKKPSKGKTFKRKGKNKIAKHTILYDYSDLAGSMNPGGISGEAGSI